MSLSFPDRFQWRFSNFTFLFILWISRSYTFLCHYGAFKMIYFLNLTRETNDLFFEVLISIKSEVLDSECSILKKMLSFWSV